MAATTTTGDGKVALVGSERGHLLQLLQLKDWYAGRPRVWATFDKPDAVHYLTGERVQWIHYPTNRHIPNLIRNTVTAWRFLRRERPALIVSTGAGERSHSSCSASSSERAWCGSR